MLTPNLKLIIDNDLTADAKSNLNKIDALGSATLVDSTGNLRLRSKQNISLLPNSNDIGGSGVGGTVSIGANGSAVSSLTIYSDNVLINDSAVVTADLAENSIEIGNDSDVRAVVDTLSIGHILADHVTGLTLKDNIITNSMITAAAGISLNKLEAVTANRVLLSDSSGFISSSSVTNTELGYLAGATSNLQAQINALGGANQLAATWVPADGLNKIVTHGFNSRNIMVQVLDANNDYINIEVESITRPTNNTISLISNQLPETSWIILINQIG